MQAALDRHLKEKGYSLSIIKDREFLSSRKVLEGKARKLQNEGKGKLPNKSRSLTREEDEVPWECGQLGNSSPRSLLTQGGGSCHSILVYVSAKNTTQ